MLGALAPLIVTIVLVRRLSRQACTSVKAFLAHPTSSLRSAYIAFRAVPQVVAGSELTGPSMNPAHAFSWYYFLEVTLAPVLSAAGSYLPQPAVTRPPPGSACAQRFPGLSGKGYVSTGP